MTSAHTISSQAGRAAAETAAAGPDSNDRAVGIWLLVCCAMIFAMAVIGAITRLTESGLSIMEWAPVKGALPPLSQAEWERVFALYREIPEYRESNPGMTLEEFRTIFWWEWIHRLWGRLIGLLFFLPFVWFLLRRRLRRGLTPHLAAMFLLGGLQGVIGWYMVASGFAERTDVSQYRLVIHLLLAVAIYVYILWAALGLLEPRPPLSPDARAAGLRRAMTGLAALVFVTIASGGFVAGLNAGFIFNTFPLMDGRLVPADYGDLAPWHLNLFENHAAVQFNHRVLAIASLALAIGLWLRARGLELAGPARRAVALVLLVTLLQLGLGIATLLLVVPVWLAALHQAGALALLTFAVWARHRLRVTPI
jgi:cytochrome c oxidase assembly protein subunit 15